MSRQLGSGEFTVAIKLRITQSTMDALRQEAALQNITVASILRSCIDNQLDPENRLEMMLKRRSSPLELVMGKFYPLLDAGEQDAFDELSASGATEEALVTWLKTHADSA